LVLTNRLKKVGLSFFVGEIMKRVKNIYEKIIDMKNLEAACHFASKGKKRRKSVLRVLQQQKEKLEFLHELLRNETYHPMKYNKKTIIDRCTCKIREIFVPKFYPDQIVQWALMLELKPILLKGMYDYCCASVDGRGGLYGINAVKKWLKRDEKNTKYCLVCDVKKFYPSVDQDILMEKFKRKLKDSKTLRLIEKIIYSTSSGLPIGNFTSQWFANFYLQDFDHYVKEQLKIKYYIRYMDDMLFFASNKRELGKKRILIEKYLKSEKLTLKNNWQVFKVSKNKDDGRPIDFLGYKFYRDYVTMRARTFLRTVRRIRKVSKKNWLTAKDSSAVLSYSARIKVVSGQKLYNKYLKPYVNLGACRHAVSVHDKKVAWAQKQMLLGKVKEE